MRHLAGVLVVAMSWAAFDCAPVDQLYDSRYALLLSEQLLRGRTSLDAGFPDGPPRDATAWNLREKDGRVEWRLALGTSVLSIPFVAVANAGGASVADPVRGYDYESERRLQRMLASLLMAATAGLLFAIAARTLPPAWSAGVAGVSVLGTPIWSTASRGLWSHTWGIFLLTLGLWLLVRGRGRPATAGVTAALATCLSWAIFVRPTFALSWGAVALLLALRRPRALLVYTTTSLLWLAVFGALALAITGTLVPDYYLRGATGQLSQGVAGLLLSPARGLVVYVPVVLFVVAAGAAHWRRVPDRLLVGIAGGTFVVHVIAVALLEPRWYGGHCYGARYLSDVIPWLAVAGSGVVAAWREAPPGLGARATLGALCMLSIAMQVPGAWHSETLVWNARPTDIDRDPERLWSWRDPPFLAPWRRSEPDS